MNSISVNSIPGEREKNQHTDATHILVRTNKWWKRLHNKPDFQIFFFFLIVVGKFLNKQSIAFTNCYYQKVNKHNKNNNHKKGGIQVQKQTKKKPPQTVIKMSFTSRNPIFANPDEMSIRHINKQTNKQTNFCLGCTKLLTFNQLHYTVFVSYNRFVFQTEPK